MEEKENCTLYITPNKFKLQCIVIQKSTSQETMTANVAASALDNDDFLAKCEEELKDRFTDKDEEFMRIFNMEPSIPPIVESWRVPNNSGRRDDRRNHRHHHPYERQSGGRDGRYGGNRDNDRRDRGDRGNYDRRGYNAHSSGYEDRGHQGYGNKNSRY